MLLRDHPLMTYRGLRNWPPVWFCTDVHNQHPKGEGETLQAVCPSGMHPPNRRCQLMSHEGSAYLGWLLFDNPTFGSQVIELLKAHCNRCIAEIGGLDLSQIA